ncbi:YopJ/AvrA family T3SS effector serine/threonine acetyltransferase [Serratia symbiotica]|uniref:YopJ/AvrA family T3SS effector serine/threonine acetyltransferase n=1 Tax=Serratia symbiotica TaxID=138074 RepID=UPI00136082DB|nr:YopJ/AvrA family T3SS effector serine/threonine acetyltransferase [Serratia symbiotica]MBQ0956609.1 YopJ family type III secretion system effector serine/threonine acetyltransferase [Serratia symbiotica]
MPGSLDSINRANSSLKKEDDTLLSDESLKSIITRLENDISDGSWIYTNYVSTDIKMMPALVDQANNKYPEMNLKFITTPQDLPIAIKNAIDDGIESSRLITNMGDRGTHFSIIDYKIVNNKTSLVLFEPTTFNGLGSAMLALRTKMAIECYQLPDCYFSLVEMDIQQSSSECGIFSLALAKKLYLESDKLEKIHKDNIDGVLCERGATLSHEKLDKYLPANFYKHTQSINRLNEYVKSNPEAENKIINKKNETIFERFNNNLVVINDKSLSISSHKKRISEYKSLIKS